MSDRLPPILDGAIGCTRALYTNWLWVKALKLQIDAGDGCAIGLGTHVGSPRVLALTHGHSDHLLGLPNLLGSRQFGTLTSGGPLTIVHPPACPNVAAMRRLVADLWSHVEFDRVTWVPLAPGERFALDAHRTLIPFVTQHVDYLPTQGYAVVERRRRLTAAARAMDEATLRERLRVDGKAAWQEGFEHPVFVHTGDTMPVDVPWFEQADVLVYDTTFLEPGDRDYPSHAALPEVLAIAIARRVKTLVLHHVSMRYAREALVEEIRRRLPTERPQVVLWDDMRWTTL